MATESLAQSDKPAVIGWLRARWQHMGLSIGQVLLLAALILLPVIFPAPYTHRLLVASLLFGAQAMVFDFTGGYINAVNFGFAAFVGLGAYTSGLLAVNFGLTPWIGMLAGACAAGLLGFITGWLTLPLRGIYISLMAWFVGMALMALAYAMVGVTRGAQGINVPYLLDTPNMRVYYYILLAITVTLYIILRFVIRSRVGLAFRAIGQNVDAARASGVDPTRYKLINFTLSCACAGLLGGFYAHLIGVLTPSVMVTDNTIQVMALSYIGGTGTLLGGLITAFLLIPALNYLKSLEELRLIIYGMLLILTMILYPAGLNGIYLWITSNFKHLINRRKNKDVEI